MLWVRELDSLDARPLPGTEVAAFPFWSPDSRSIGFVDVDLESTEFGMLQALFATTLCLTPNSMWMNQYAVANDGQSFLLNRPFVPSAAAITALVPR